MGFDTYQAVCFRAVSCKRFHGNCYVFGVFNFLKTKRLLICAGCLLNKYSLYGYWLVQNLHCPVLLVKITFLPTLGFFNELYLNG